MPPAPEAGVEEVVPELAGVAGRAAGPRRRRARVARHGVAGESRLDVAGGLPGAGEVVVVLHWFLWLVTAFPSCCLLAGTQDKGGGGRRWWSSLGARRAQLIKGGGQVGLGIREEPNRSVPRFLQNFGSLIIGTDRFFLEAGTE